MDKTKKWRWCLHCERCYEQGEFRLIDGLKFCPYENCDGDVFFDGQPWGQVREQNKKMNWPVIPEKNKEYSPYNQNMLFLK